MQFELPDGANHKDVEQAVILKLLDEHDGNVSAVARQYGRSRGYLHRRINQMGLKRKLVADVPPAPPPPPPWAAPTPKPPAARLAHKNRDLLTPEVRAELDKMKAAKPKRAGKHGGETRQEKHP